MEKLIIDRLQLQIADRMGMQISDAQLEQALQQIAKEKELREKYGITTVSEAELFQIMKETIEKEGDKDEA